MENTCIVGMQWGDEGKGKITDVLAEKVDMVARFSGGNNAGHTIVIEDKKIKLHHVPSGIVRSEVKCFLGNGMVINLEVLKGELETLKQMGIAADNLYISENAHLIMPYHILADEAQEERRGKKKIGTTKRGIGPAYTDKATRTGIRVVDLHNKKIFKEKLKYHFAEKADYISGNLNLDEVFNTFTHLYDYFKDKIADTSLLLYNELSKGKKALFEGAQGALLDIDLGTYPFVTSTMTLAGGASVGLGIPSFFIEKVIGIVKAYTTRVGTGPFPTEDTGDIGGRLREAGAEYGTTTGRPRRCGYLDLVLLKYAKRINGVTSLAVTKLDVLTGLKKIKVAVGYKYNGKILKEYPQDQNVFALCEPVYEEMPGWDKDIDSALTYEELPKEAKRYLDFIQNTLDIPVEYISVGPKRCQIIKK
ncbi:MAG: adenylosuccinate synthase [Armatimonadota bacterium]